jgi:hypothetical protein
MVEGIEQCDDSNAVNVDNCKNDCTTAICGDGTNRVNGNCKLNPSFACNTVGDCPAGPGQDCVGPDDTTTDNTEDENCDSGGPLAATCDSTSCQTASCGDGNVTANEECEIGVGGQTANTCAGCVDTCGNGMVDANENCDGALVPATCASFAPNNHGTVTCTATCTYDSSDCSVCGNGMVEDSEQCEVGVGGATTYTCAACQNTCGNGMVDANENCDGASIPSTCSAQTAGAEPNGALACTGCQYDTAPCGSCGDGSVQTPGETCEIGVGGATANSCAACQTTCGNGMVDANENCDDSDLNGATCSSIAPFDSGTLGCSATCSFDTSGCGDCGNGMVDGDEDCEPFAAVCVGGFNDGDACTDDSDCIDGTDPTNAALQGSCGKNHGCTTSCTEATCGNGGGPEFGEECDNGTATCTSPGSYDGEECGTVTGLAACTADLGVCGPGNKDYAAGACRTNCYAAFCGDGVKDPTELCDDGFLSGGTTPAGRGVADEADNCPNGFGTRDTPLGGGIFAACRTYNVCGDGIPLAIDSSARCEGGTGCASGTDTCAQSAPACDGGGDTRYTCRPTIDGAPVSTAAAKYCRLNVGQTCTTDADCGGGDTCGNDNNLANHCRTVSSTVCANPSCGDDVQDAGEGCDDGAAVCVSAGPDNGEPCGTTAELAACADDPAPSCKDALGTTCNANLTDAVGGACNTDLTGTSCSVGCAGPNCGDSVINPGEQCDAGGNNGMAPGTCTTTCQSNICGDGETLGTEQCDDENVSNNDACISTGGDQCKDNVCGDGYLFAGTELCEPLGGNGPDGVAQCNAECCPLAGLNLTTNAQRFAAADCALDIYEADMQNIVPVQRQHYLQRQIDRARRYADDAEASIGSDPTVACYRLRGSSRAMSRSNRRLNILALRSLITAPQHVQLQNEADVPAGWYNAIRQALGCP